MMCYMYIFLLCIQTVSMFMVKQYRTKEGKVSKNSDFQLASLSIPECECALP